MFDFEFIRDNWLFITLGTGVTLEITLSSFFLAVPIGIMLAKARRSAFLLLRVLSSCYVFLVDGIPLLLQIFFIFLALPQLGIFLPGIWSAVFVLAVYYSARLSAIFYERSVAVGGIQEGIRPALVPILGKELTATIKDTTLIATTGFIHDVFWRATRAGRAEFHMLEALTVAALVYLILNTTITLGLGAIGHNQA